MWAERICRGEKKSDEGVDRARRTERGRFGGRIYCSVEKRMEEGGGGGEEEEGREIRQVGL